MDSANSLSHSAAESRVPHPHNPKERKRSMEIKKYQGTIILKDGKNIRPIIEANTQAQALMIFKAQYPDARLVAASVLPKQR